MSSVFYRSSFDYVWSLFGCGGSFLVEPGAKYQYCTLNTSCSALFRSLSLLCSLSLFRSLSGSHARARVLSDSLFHFLFLSLWVVSLFLSLALSFSLSLSPSLFFCLCLSLSLFLSLYICMCVCLSLSLSSFSRSLSGCGPTQSWRILSTGEHPSPIRSWDRIVIVEKQPYGKVLSKKLPRQHRDCRREEVVSRLLFLWRYHRATRCKVLSNKLTNYWATSRHDKKEIVGGKVSIRDCCGHCGREGAFSCGHVTEQQVAATNYCATNCKILKYYKVQSWQIIEQQGAKYSSVTSRKVLSSNVTNDWATSCHDNKEIVGGKESFQDCFFCEQKYLCCTALHHQCVVLSD